MFSFNSEPTLDTFTVRSRSNEPGNQFESMDTKSRNGKWDVSKAVSMSFSNKLVLKDWNYRTPITGMLNLFENKFDYKKNNLWRLHETCTR